MRAIVVLLIVAFCVSLAACASTGPAPSLQQTANEHRVDVRKMAAIESVARKRGVEVKWVNPPQVRKRG